MAGTQGSADRKDLREVTSLLSDLIRIPSVNSSSSPEGHLADVEKLFEISEFVRGWLDGRGISARIVEFEKGYPVVVAKAGRGKRKVMLNGHMDVVPPGDLAEWKSDPFSCRISAGRVFGRGATDMKGGLAVQMHAMASLADRSDCALMLAAVSDEETGGSHGAKHLAGRYAPDLVLIAEPTSGAVVLGEKGILSLEMTVRGRTAHASRPSKGRNAITAMSEKLASLSNITRTAPHAPLSARKLIEDSESVFGEEVSRITFNPSKISGGVKGNLVPDRCDAEIDLRLPVGITTGEAFAAARKLVGSAELRRHYTEEPNYTEPGNAYARSFVDSVTRMAGSPRQVIFPAATDGEHFRRKGIPTITYGPGNLDIAHVCNESVGLDELAAAYGVYRDFLSGAFA